MTKFLTALGKICFICFFTYCFTACKSKEKSKSRELPPLNIQSVATVDLSKYAGKWFEIASIPQRFQKGCTGTTATYTLSEKGNFVEVYNKCYKDSLTGKVSDIKGKAFVQPNTGNAQLKVQFFWPFKADYWIVHLDSAYQYAAVSAPSGNYFWILSRTPEMPESIYVNIMNDAYNMGIDTSKIKRTLHGNN